MLWFINGHNIPYIVPLKPKTNKYVFTICKCFCKKKKKKSPRPTKFGNDFHLWEESEMEEIRFFRIKQFLILPKDGSEET